MPLQSVLQMLCVINHVLNNGEKLSLSDISILKIEQENLIRDFEIKEIEKLIQNEGESFYDFRHNSMDIEEYMLSIIRKGNVDELSKLFKTIPAIRNGILAQDGLRQAKNILIVTSTLVSRCAIQGGMEIEEALNLSDTYIQKVELLNNIEAITNLTYRLVMDFTQRMGKIQYGNTSSKLVIEVSNYINHHLYESIKVNNLAKKLGRGRSRLSTDFKKTTGENLSSFILRKKIEESKRLLKYSNKSSVNIAFYLGFSSHSHFIKVFKKYTYLTPNEYRQLK